MKEHGFHEGRHQNCAVVPLLLEGELFHLSHDLFYRSTAESIFTCSTSSWFDNSAVVQSHNLNKIMRTAEEIIGVLLPHLQDIYQNSARTKPAASSRTANTLHIAGLHSGKIQKQEKLPSTVRLPVCTKQTQVFIFVNI